MKSSQPYPDQIKPAAGPVVLVADGGAQAVSHSARDPFEALDDLMTVVEALCPRWPSRESFGPMWDLRI